MTRRQVLPWALVPLPLLLGLLLSLAVSRGWLGLGNPAQQARFDAAWLWSVGGILLTLLLGTAVFLNHHLRRATARGAQQAANAFAAQNREFLRRLDHELKNPLTIIRLGVVNLQQSSQLDEAQQQSLGRIGQQTERLQQLVVDLRRLTELEAATLEMVPVDLAEVLAEAVALAGEAMPDKQTVTLTVQETPWPVSPIRGDRELLILAFRNLIDNGLKYTAVSDRVEVRVSDDGQAAVVEVADSGMGIPEQELAHVFENLFRGEQARGIAGSGLGLPLVQRVVQLHGGSVAVRSRSQTGTVFTVRLPL